MSELPSLVADLAIILIAAGLTTILFKWLRQPVVLGYIVAGFLVGPHCKLFPSVVDNANIQTWADIGVIFLLFALGLDFSFKKLINVGGSALITACTILVGMSFIGYWVGTLMGWSHMNCVFLGGMISMSSTMIIIKTFDDLQLNNKQFAKLVFGVLVVEDLFAVVMMVLLSTLAVKHTFEGIQFAGFIVKLLFFLLLWFLVGIYLIPSFLKKTRRFLNEEMLLIVSLGLCLLMVLFATKAGFSAPLGAFVMGSILAETLETERIIQVVKPVKDLFGAIFFISVGGMIDPVMLGQYIGPILILTLVVIFGQVLSATTGVLLSGQPLKTAVQSGFCFSQIGEFAFIIAGLGLSLHVTSDFLYPIVVAVSVVTTFFSPYIIKLSNPTYKLLERKLPRRWIRFLDRYSLGSSSVNRDNVWKSLLKQLARIVIIYSVISVAIIILSFSYLVPRITAELPGLPGKILSALLVLLLISPFLRAMMMKKNHSDEMQYLWKDRRFNRGPLILVILLRVVFSIAFIAVVLARLFEISFLIILLAFIIVVAIIMSRRLKKQSILIERHFKRNLNERQEFISRKTPYKEHFVNHLLSRDLHLTDYIVRQNSPSVGHTLSELNFRQKCGVNVISITRGNRHINIPGGDVYIYPMDKITVLGTDEQLTTFMRFIAERNRKVEEEKVDNYEVTLDKIVLESGSPFIGKSIAQSRIREDFGCMVVGIERNSRSIMNPPADTLFYEEDVLWVAGERARMIAMAGMNTVV